MSGWIRKKCIAFRAAIYRPTAHGWVASSPDVALWQSDKKILYAVAKDCSCSWFINLHGPGLPYTFCFIKSANSFGPCALDRPFLVKATCSTVRLRDPTMHSNTRWECAALKQEIWYPLYSTHPCDKVPSGSRGTWIVYSEENPSSLTNYGAFYKLLCV